MPQVAAGYVEANVEDTSGPANVGAPDGPNSSGAIRSAERAAILGSLDEWVPIQADGGPSNNEGEGYGRMDDDKPTMFQVFV